MRQVKKQKRLERQHIPNAEPMRPKSSIAVPTWSAAKTGPAAMWEEFADYKAANMLAVWRYKWREFLL